MIASPLRLEWYFIKELRVAWQSEYDESKASPMSVSDLSVEVTPSQSEEEPLKWAFEVSIALEDNTGKRFPYIFQIVLVGFFEIANAYAEKNPNGAELLAIVNGPAVLYSAAREHITTLTSRGPYPEVVLPTVTFLPIEEKPKSAEEPRRLRPAKDEPKSTSKKARKRVVQKV
jgi:preprotein translocase subunit SecB